MNVLRVRRVVPLLAAVSLLAYGCASPPEAEQKAAQSAVSAARAAGADKYARSEYGAMDSALKAAESEMGAKKYKEAKEGYEKAKGLAETAAKAAEGGKAAMKAEVEKQVGDLEKRWKDLAGKVKAAAKKLKAEQKQAWEADAKSLTGALQAAKDAVGADPAGAKDKLAAAVASIDKWGADLAALAAPAAAKAPAAKPDAKPAAKKPAAKKTTP